MQQVGYINNAGKNIKVEFTLMQNRIAPKNAQDAEILISAWDINDEILEAFLDFVNYFLRILCATDFYWWSSSKRV